MSGAAEGHRERRSHVRWGIVALLVGFSAASYAERINISVAGPFLRKDLGLSDAALGYIFSAFLISYTVAQIPSGMLADRFGPRRVYAWAAAAWFVITIALASAVGVTGATGLWAVGILIGLRALLGLAEAPTYPTAARTIAAWFPGRERASANAIIQSASFAGSALTLPLMAGAVVLWSWEGAMIASAAPALIIGVSWWLYARDTPEEHPSVSPQEMRLIRGDQLKGDSVTAPASFQAWNVTVLSASYFFHGYVGYLFFFWFYSYLIDVRGFSIASGGLVAALPIIAAAVFALLGGWSSDQLAQRWGNMEGRRAILFISGIVGAACLAVGAFAVEPALAIAGFTLAIGTRGFVEASYWTLAIEVGGPRTGLAAGIMNTSSNLGGAISTASAPLLVHLIGWPNALAIAAAATAISGLLGAALRRRDPSPAAKA